MGTLSAKEEDRVFLRVRHGYHRDRGWHRSLSGISAKRRSSNSSRHRGVCVRGDTRKCNDSKRARDEEPFSHSRPRKPRGSRKRPRALLTDIPTLHLLELLLYRVLVVLSMHILSAQVAYIAWKSKNGQVSVAVAQSRPLLRLCRAIFSHTHTHTIRSNISPLLSTTSENFELDSRPRLTASQPATRDSTKLPPRHGLALTFLTTSLQQRNLQFKDFCTYLDLDMSLLEV